MQATSKLVEIGGQIIEVIKIKSGDHDCSWLRDWRFTAKQLKTIRESGYFEPIPRS